MKVSKDQLADENKKSLKIHQEEYKFLEERLGKKGFNPDELTDKINALQIAIPSWALGAGGTRFARFPFGGEPASLEDKIEDVGLLHALTASCNAISLHIPWDIPENSDAIKSLAASFGLKFDAVNSNTFQDQKDQSLSYKFGSLAHTDKAVRKQAVDHNIEVIKYGELLGSKALTVWLADGSCFPGQLHFKKAFKRTLDSLQEIYEQLPSDWKVFIEYKPYEPNFYSTVIQDWGTSFLMASKLGEKAYTLVDLGHHLPNTNIEQIVATLMMEGKLGGFHFNDSKYGDDDLTVGSIKPYQLFLIFNELVDGMQDPLSANPDLAWMIDASHNVKDPLEDLLQSVEAINIAYARALLVDRALLQEYQESNDPVKTQEILQDAFRTDVRPLLAEARLRSGAALNPIDAYRSLGIRSELKKSRGTSSIATGL